MAHAFIEEDYFVTGRRAILADPPNLQWALMDLKSEGVENLNSIAEFYGLDASFLMGRYVRSIETVNY
jgi:hypothetical protein